MTDFIQKMKEYLSGNWVSGYRCLESSREISCIYWGGWGNNSPL